MMGRSEFSRRIPGVVRGATRLGASLAVCAFAAGAASRDAPGSEPPAAHVRTIYLVRHGLYEDHDTRDPERYRALTPEGREQARLTGARLAKLPGGIDAVHASPYTRARETAEIIAQALRAPPPDLSRDLRECTPPTERADVMARYRPGEPDSCRERLERAFGLYFRPSPGRDSAEVVVCHGNVIRWMTSRALGVDPALWLRMTIANCSVTTIQIRPDGRPRLVSFDDTGHLPARLVVYPPYEYDPGVPPRKP
jgi:serine/threonine-protein phosphatase PGAM5